MPISKKDFDKKTTTVNRIREFLKENKDQAFTPKEIQDALKVESYDTIHGNLRSLLHNGEILKNDEGFYIYNV